jgi:hypothetical protein
VYKLTLRLFQLTSNFIREYKFTLGQDMKRDAILLVRSIYRANRVREKVPYLEQLYNELNEKTWEPRPSTCFIVTKPVRREIFAAAFRDRIVHHILINRLLTEGSCIKDL